MRLEVVVFPFKYLSHSQCSKLSSCFIPEQTYLTMVDHENPNDKSHFLSTLCACAYLLTVVLHYVSTLCNANKCEQQTTRTIE